MQDRFEEFFKLLMTLEGGESDNKNDKGGHTNYGITQYLYNRIQDKLKLPRKSVSKISIEEAKNIYLTEFYKIVKTPLDKELHYNYFDMCVNSGFGNYLKLVTANPVNVYQWRQSFFDKIVETETAQKVFIKGWYNRLAKIKAYFKQGGLNDSD